MEKSINKYSNKNYKIFNLFLNQWHLVKSVRDRLTLSREAYLKDNL